MDLLLCPFFSFSYFLLIAHVLDLRTYRRLFLDIEILGGKDISFTSPLTIVIVYVNCIAHARFFFLSILSKGILSGRRVKGKFWEGFQQDP